MKKTDYYIALAHILLSQQNQSHFRSSKLKQMRRIIKNHYDSVEKLYCAHQSAAIVPLSLVYRSTGRRSALALRRVNRRRFRPYTCIHIYKSWEPNCERSPFLAIREPDGLAWSDRLTDEKAKGQYAGLFCIKAHFRFLAPLSAQTTKRKGINAQSRKK